MDGPSRGREADRGREEGRGAEEEAGAGEEARAEAFAEPRARGCAQASPRSRARPGPEAAGRSLQSLVLLIFDFDGVVADTEIVSNTVLAEALTEIGLATSLEDALRTYLGRNWRDCAELIEK